MNTQWTIVTRDKGGRFFRPVAGAPVGSWDDAVEAARELGRSLGYPEGLEIAYVPTQDSPQLEEDRDNILDEDTDKRWAIRWDAEPKHSFPAPADLVFTTRPGGYVRRTQTVRDGSHRESVYAKAVGDTSPTHVGYEGDCGWCWLGAGHTVAEHDRRMGRAS